MAGVPSNDNSFLLTDEENVVDGDGNVRNERESMFLGSARGSFSFIKGASGYPTQDGEKLHYKWTGFFMIDADGNVKHDRYAERITCN